MSLVRSAVPPWAVEQLRSGYHLYVYGRHLKNGLSVWRQRKRQPAMPPLRFRNGMIWHHGPYDEPLFIMRELYAQRLYQPLGEAPRGATVIDIGANLGALTMYWSAGRPDLQFHAYEPNPQAFATLTKNIEANRLSKQVKTYNEAVGRTCGTLDLWIDIPTSHSSAFGHSGFQGGRQISTQMITLDEVWERTGRSRIHMLKIDTEGAEVDILAGASDAALAAVDNAVIEYHDNLVPGAFAACRKRLDAAGFTYRVYEHPWDEGIIYATRRTA